MSNSGGEFMGCANYPQCQYTENIVFIRHTTVPKSHHIRLSEECTKHFDSIHLNSYYSKRIKGDPTTNKYRYQLLSKKITVITMTQLEKKSNEYRKY